MRAEDMFRPPVSEVQRVDPVHPRTAYPQENVRYEVQVPTELAPIPPQDTANSGQGRDIMHATPHMWRYQSLAISEYGIDRIIGWPFRVPKVPSAAVVNMPYGRQTPIRERTNIEMPHQSSLGEQTQLAMQRSWTPNLLKIA